MIIADDGPTASGKGTIAKALAVHFGWQVATVDIDDPKRCLAVFRSNRDAGLIVALAIVLG